MSSNDEFSEWLLNVLSQRGWDQAELSRRSQTTTALSSRMLSGERRPGAVVARRLARALQLPPEEVFRQAGLLPRSAFNPIGLDELDHIYNALDDGDRKRMLALARALRDVSNMV